MKQPNYTTKKDRLSDVFWNPVIKRWQGSNPPKNIIIYVLLVIEPCRPTLIDLKTLTGFRNPVKTLSTWSKSAPAKWLFLENQQSFPPWLGFTSGRRYPRQSAIPKKLTICSNRMHGTATYFYQPSPDLLWDMHTDSRSDGDVDWQLSSWVYQSAGEVETSSPDIILAGSAVRQSYYFQELPCKLWHKK